VDVREREREREKFKGVGELSKGREHPCIHPAGKSCSKFREAATIDQPP